MFWLARLLCRKALRPLPIDLGLRKSALRGVRLEGFKDPREVVLCLQPFFGAPSVLISRGYMATRTGAQIDAEIASVLSSTSRFRRVLGTWSLLPSWCTHLWFTSRPSPLRAVGMTLALPWHRLFLAIAGRTLDPMAPLPGFAAARFVINP